MLRCSGCGDLVSEFAARCPACHRGVGDAVEVEDLPAAALERPVQPAPSAPVAESALGSSFRAPPTAPAALLRALAGMVAAMLAAATGGALGGVGHPPAPAALGDLRGEVVAVTATGAVSWVDPASGRREPPPTLDGLATIDPVAVSSDGTILLNGSGELITLDAEGFVARPTVLPRFLSSATSPARPSAFADSNRAVLLLTRTTALGPNAATVVDLANGGSFDLGTVDSAAGDPQTFGAFVSIPTRPFQPRRAHPTSSDRSVELMIAGRKPTILATAARLEQVVGLPPATPVQMQVYPNGTGDAVAVVLQPLTPEDGNVPMVIVDRAGDVFAAVPNSAGPVYETTPVWSPGGHQIAYETKTARGYALAVATETGTVQTESAPRGASMDRCTWAPASTDVVCSGQTADRSFWVYATPRSPHLIARPSAGDPVAWLATPPLALPSAGAG